VVRNSNRQVGLHHPLSFHQKRKLGGETKHGEQQQRTKGRIWRSFHAFPLAASQALVKKHLVWGF
jgi:hypothetical protein